MIKQKTQLETEINGKAQVYQCDPTATLPEVFEGLNVFRNYIIGRIKDAEEQAKTQQPSQ